MAGTTPSIQEQRAFIKANFEGVTVQEGETWYPLNAEWWNSLLMHVQWQTQSGGEEGEEGEGKDEAPSPGAIDNAALADAVTPLALKAGLEEGKVFVWVKEPLWKQLVAWYGGGAAFPRSTTVLEGAYLASIDMYPQPCKCFTAGDDGEPVVGSAVTFLSNRKVNFAQTAKAVHGALKSTATPGTWRVWVRETVEDKWELVPGAGQEGSATALEVVAKNHPFTQFLLETKVGGAYKRSVESAAAEGASSAPADTPEWRAGLQEGSWLDAQDSEDKWYAARIFAVVEEGQDEKLTAKGTALAGKPGRKFHVQFETWSIAYAEWFAESSTKLAPLRTHSKAWRDALRPLSLVEHSLPDAKGELRWYLLKIRTVNRAANPPMLTLVAESDITRKVLPESTEVPLDAMTLAPAYTHTKKPVAVAAANNARRGYQLANVGRGGGSFGRWARHRAGRAHEAGAVGLDNLGNTCFMNSMLQCLTASQPLTEHFLSGAWESEVNVDNVLGQGGRIAAAYASLMEAMWSGQYAVCSPGEVKGEVGKAAPQFQGFQQHDSQELMSFLLDGIHEDLNRVLKKPYVEDVSSMGRPDPVVALEAWKRYKLRNDSVVVDTFTGQFRSHLTCNVCGEQSVTFDPFTSVSVPVSEFESKKTLVCTFAPGNPAWHAVRYRSFVPKHGVLGDIVDWIATEAVFPIAEDLEESKEAEEVKEGEEGAPPTEAAPAAAAGGTGGSAPPTPALEAADMMCVKVNFRSHCIASFCGRQDSVGDIQGNDWMYIYQVPKPTDPAHVALEKGWAAKAERAIAARAAARAGKAVETEEGESEEELLAFTYIENRPYVVELRMRQAQARATYMAAAGTKVGYGVPELVSIPNVTGSVDEAVLPTGKALYADVWGRMAKYIKPEAQEKYSPENPPFALSVAPVPNRRAPGTLGALVPVEYTDEGVAIDRYEEVLVVDWSPEAAADRVDAGSGDMARQEKTSYGDRVDKDDETSIKSCFKRFVSKEQLGSNDKWYCPHCKEHVQAYKQMSLYSLPDVLVVHLKRFHVTNYGRQMTSFLSRSKLDNYVGYPLEGLDVSEFVSGPQTGPHMYDCFAVSDHMGGMGGGHYVAYSKNFRSGKWYSCNDSSVSPASPDSIVSRRNYVLFFRKRTPSGMKSAAHLVAAAAAAEAAAPSAPAGAAE